MFQLKRAHLVQFFLFQAETLELDLATAIIAPNGAGKSALLDALQIVMLGADRNQIRFNAQAGGIHRARTIRDYCLGVYRVGDDGRTRETATTYLSLVFEDQGTGEVLTAGIALGASAQEPDHRIHGRYLLPRVGLTLEDHLELVKGAEIPLEWSHFQELIAKHCKDAGSKADLHTTGDRFVKDMLFRLRPGPTSFLDAVAYRKAFQNALNLQRVSDVDLFVRTLVAEERPTEIANFRALLDGFRQIKEKIEQVTKRIDDAEVVEHHYKKVESQVIRAASYRTLAAEYERDQHSEKVDHAEGALVAAENEQRQKIRALTQARSDRDTARHESEDANKRLQGAQGYNEQASLDEIARRDKTEMGQLKTELMRSAGYVRDQLNAAGKLNLPSVDRTLLTNVILPWQRLYERISAAATDAEIDLSPEALHVELQQAIEQAGPVISAVKQYVHELQNALDQTRQRAQTARQNQARLSAGHPELRSDVIRLMSYLEEEGITVRPVCDLVQVKDPAWQRSIEAYLRSHVEALLVPPEHEERAVRLYCSLQGARSVYGVKLALTSQARQSRTDSEPTSDQVAGLLMGDNADALGYLRRQLGDLRCIESDTEVVRARHGLSRDGLVVKGGGVERLRLPAASELRIGASDNRERQKQLREDIEVADRETRQLENQWKVANGSATGLARIENADEVAKAAHDLLLKHREAAGRYRSQQRMQTEQFDPDLIRLTQAARDLGEQAITLQDVVEQLTGEEAVAGNKVEEATDALDVLNVLTEAIVRRASAAFAHPDVDPNLVENQRQELDGKFPELAERLVRCQSRSEDCDKALNTLLPEAWAGLSQYGKDHRLVFELESNDWRRAITMLQREISHLKGTELVQHQAAADEAYLIAVDTFRSNVASALYDNFSRLKQQIRTLNRTLQRSPAFSNDERYQFRYEVAPEFKELHRFINKAADVGEADNLFGSAGEVPSAFRDIIEEKVGGKGATMPSPLDDYRRFFNFEVNIKQGDAVIGTLSERMRSGSGGEHRAPLYIIAGAALAAAYGKSEGHSGGLGVIMLDEFGDKIDAQNARAVTNYLRALGLQLILAAPDTAQGTLTGVLDSYVELFRDGALLQIERTRVNEAGRELLESDQFLLHPDLLEQEIARITAQRLTADDVR